MSMAKIQQAQAQAAAAAATAEDKKADEGSKRLHDLAISRRLLSRHRANPKAPLKPSKVVVNCDGKDIVKRGQRKSKYLFAFPGLVAPVAGGKLGDLTNLDSKNPILYIDFPQGRLKMFGTIIYPKNKYLSLQFSRGAGNIMCDDAFESFVVFSDVWWIGTHDENPEELRLPLPPELEQVQEKHTNFSFAAGAGRAVNPLQDADPKKHAHEPKSPDITPIQSQFEESQQLNEGSILTPVVETKKTPLRQSSRTAAKTYVYAESSSDCDESSSRSESSDHVRASTSRKRVAQTSNERLIPKDAEQTTSHLLSLDSGDEETKNHKSSFSIRNKDITDGKAGEPSVTSLPMALKSDSLVTREPASPTDDLQSSDHETTKPDMQTSPGAKKKGDIRASITLKQVARKSSAAKQSRQKVSSHKEDPSGAGGSSKKRRVSAPLVSNANSRKKPKASETVKQRDKKVVGALSSQESARKKTAGKQKSFSLDESLDKSDGGISDDQEMSDSSDEDYVG